MSVIISQYIYIYIILPAACQPACVQAGVGSVSKPFQFTESNCFCLSVHFPGTTTTVYITHRWDNTLNSAIEECKKKGLKAGELATVKIT